MIKIKNAAQLECLLVRTEDDDVLMIFPLVFCSFELFQVILPVDEDAANS